MKNGSLWSCAGIGRFSLWHSWLIWAKRLVNLALKARVPTAPNSPLSNCSYLAAICRKSKFCKIQGMLKGLKGHAACNVARLYEISHVEGVERNNNRHNRLDLGHLILMSKESKVHSIYTVDPNIKSSNYMKIQLKSFELQQILKYHFELV